MPAPEFSQQDAQNIIALAQNAPLRNLHEAQAVSQMLERFQAWFDFVSTPALEAPPKSRKPRKLVEESSPTPSAEDLTK